MHVPATQPSTGHCVSSCRLIQWDILFHANWSVDVVCGEGREEKGEGREEKGGGRWGVKGKGGRGVSGSEIASSYSGAISFKNITQ